MIRPFPLFNSSAILTLLPGEPSCSSTSGTLSPIWTKAGVDAWNRRRDGAARGRARGRRRAANMVSVGSAVAELRVKVVSCIQRYVRRGVCGVWARASVGFITAQMAPRRHKIGASHSQLSADSRGPGQPGASPSSTTATACRLPGRRSRPPWAPRAARGRRVPVCSHPLCAGALQAKLLIMEPPGLRPAAINCDFLFAAGMPLGPFRHCVLIARGRPKTHSRLVRAAPKLSKAPVLLAWRAQ